MNMKLTITNQVSELVRVREFVCSAASCFSLDESLTESMNLVMEEAVSNVIFYAYPKEKSHRIKIECTWGDAPEGKSDELAGRLIFCIIDTGVEFDPTARGDVDVTLPAEERDIGGLGIFIVKNIMDEVIYHRVDGRNELTLIKYVGKNQILRK